MPASDYIAIENASKVADIFASCNIPYVEGRVWTTDAIFRETKNLFQKRRAEGCIAVEMELAGVQAVCTFHTLELYNFLMTGDILDQPDYEVGELCMANHSLAKFAIALLIAEKI